MRSLLAAMLVLSSGLAGCLDTSLLETVREDLEAEDEYVDRTLLDEEVGFSPAGIVDPNKTLEGPSDISAEWNTTVRVPEDTRRMTVRFAIDFANSGSDDGLPTNPPDGEVRVYVEGPGGEPQRNLTRNEPAQAGYAFTGPDAGDWTVGMEARGNGTVAFNVDAIVPRQASN